MRFIIALSLAALAGCAPKNYEDCKMEAAKSPTERGVTVAVQACSAKFEAPRIAAELEAAKARADSIARTWKSVQEAHTFESVVALIGKPDASMAYACKPFKDGEPAPDSCAMHFWKDPRTPEACGGHRASPSLEGIYSDGFCRWRVQTSQQGTVWATWPEPG